MGQDKGWFERVESERGGLPSLNANFPGGTAAEFFTEFGSVFDKEVNFVIQEGVDLISLPAITLQNVEMFDCIRLPELLADGLAVSSARNNGQAPASGRFMEEPSAFLMVVRVDPSVIYAFEEEASRDDSARRFDLRFGGGTAVDFVEAIREAYPGANILAMPGLEGFVVPAVNLDGVTVDAALESIEGQEAMVDGAWAKVRLSDADIEGREERVFTMSLERRETQVSSRIWSVSDIFLLNVSEQDLLSAIHAGLEITELQATVRFHPDTQVLIVMGPSEALKIVESTLREVERSAQSNTNSRSLDGFWEIRQSLDERIQKLERQVKALTQP